MGNSRVLQKATKELTKAKAPAKSRDIIYDPAGQWKFPGQDTRIPGGNITMQGVPYPVYAQPNVGQPQMMYPGAEYTFPGADYVDEYPQMKKGGRPRGLIPMPKPSKKGLASKAYSRSLDATNRLFTESYLFKKPKDKRRKVFDPNAKYYADGGEYGMPLGAGVSQNFIGNRDQFKVGGIPELPLRDNQVNYNAFVNGFDPMTKKQDGGDKDAMTGMMKARLAYANEFGNPAAQRMINLPDNPYQFDDGNTGTHYMASIDNYAVPQIQDENGQLMLGDYGPESNEAMRFDTDNDANYFAEHYKDVSPGFIEAELTDDEIEEYRKGGYIVEDISIPSLNQYDKGGRFKRRKKKQEEQEQLEYRPPVEVNDEMYESVTPFPEAPEEFKQGVGNIKEVEKKAQAPDWLKFSNEYEKKNSKQAFIDEKKREYLKGTNKGLNKLAGNSMENFPEDVERNFEKAYDYKKNSFIVKKLGKKEKFSPNRRGEWVDELSKKEKEIVANSKYENKLQPSLWDRSLAGLVTLTTPFSAQANDAMNKGELPGLTKKEQREIKDSKMFGIPTGGLESLAGWDALGVAAANALEQSGNSGYGAGYREAPGVVSAQPMANVKPEQIAVLNPLNYTLPYDIAAAAPSILKGAANVAKTTGKVLTEATPLKNASKINPWRFKENPEAAYRMLGSKEGYLDAVESGLLRPNQKTGRYDATFYNVGEPLDRYKAGYDTQYMAEVPLSNEKIYPRYEGADDYRISEEIGAEAFDNRIPKGHVSIYEPDVNLYKEHWLQGYKKVKPPKKLSESSKELSGFSDTKNLQGANVLKQIKAVPVESGIKRTLSNITNTAKEAGKDIMYQINNYSNIKNTPKIYKEEVAKLLTEKGKERLKGLGVEDMDDFMNYINRGKSYTTRGAGTWAGEMADYKNVSYPSINIDFEQLNKLKGSEKLSDKEIKFIAGHELGHNIQSYLESIGKTYKGKSYLDIEAVDELAPFIKEKPKEYLEKSRMMNDAEAENLANKLGDDDGEILNASYFFRGSKGNEPLPHLRELKQRMLNKGIINSIHDEITAKDIGNFYINHKGYKDRILSFVKPGDDSYKTLAKLLNKTPVVIPAAIGVGALQQKKKGGIVSELSNKEIKDLVAQGYIVEDVD